MKEYDSTPFIIDGAVQPKLMKYLDYKSAKKLSLCNKTLGSELQLPPPLLPYQKPHFKQLKECLYKYQRSFDTSETGLGKTYVSCMLYQEMARNNPDCKLIVFGPSIVKEAWVKATKFLGITDWEFHVYTEFRRNQKPYLILPPGLPDKIWNYIPSYEWLQTVHKGCFLILDEAHHLKNKSNQTQFMIKLTQSLLKKPKSYLHMLSATPMDKSEHAPQISQLLGMLPENYRDLAESDKGQFQKSFKEVFGRHGHQMPNHSSIYDWLSKVIKPIIYHFMPPQPKNSNVCNWFVDVGDDLEAIQSGVNSLREAIEQQMPAGHLTSIMRNIECGKARTFVTKAREQLDRDPNCKVILLLNFLEPIHFIEQELKAYNPTVIAGKVSVTKRHQIVKNFQQPNNKHRLIIGNLSILANGVDLDDIDGKFTRHLFISPSYFLINLHQAKGRVDRAKTKSIAQVKYIYAKGVGRETALLDILARKSHTLKDFLDYQLALPGDHPEIIEP